MGRLGAVASVGMEKAVQTVLRSAEESVVAADRAGRALRIKRLEPDETAPSQPEERCAHPDVGGLSCGHGDGDGLPGRLPMARRRSLRTPHMCIGVPVRARLPAYGTPANVACTLTRPLPNGARTSQGHTA